MSFSTYNRPGFPGKKGDNDVHRSSRTQIVSGKWEHSAGRERKHLTVRAKRVESHCLKMTQLQHAFTGANTMDWMWHTRSTKCVKFLFLCRLKLDIKRNSYSNWGLKCSSQSALAPAIQIHAFRLTSAIDSIQLNNVNSWHLRSRQDLICISRKVVPLKVEVPHLKHLTDGICLFFQIC